MSSEAVVRKLFKFEINKDGFGELQIFGQAANVEDNVMIAQLVQKDFLDIIENKKVTKFLVDLSPAGTDAGYPTPAAKDIWIAMANHPKLEKIAIVIPNTIFSSIVRFILGSKTKNNVETFHDVEKATNWLKGVKEKRMYSPS